MRGNGIKRGFARAVDNGARGNDSRDLLMKCRLSWPRGFAYRLFIDRLCRRLAANVCIEWPGCRPTDLLTEQIAHYIDLTLSEPPVIHHPSGDFTRDSPQRTYLSWNFCTLCLLACQAEVTVDGSGLCCRVHVRCFGRCLSPFVCWDFLLSWTMTDWCSRRFMDCTSGTCRSLCALYCHLDVKSLNSYTNRNLKQEWLLAPSKTETRKRFKRTVFIRTKIQSANFWGNFYFILSSYKTTLKTTKNWDEKLNHLSVFGWAMLFSCPVLETSIFFIVFHRLTVV